MKKIILVLTLNLLAAINTFGQQVPNEPYNAEPALYQSKVSKLVVNWPSMHMLADFDTNGVVVALTVTERPDGDFYEYDQIKNDNSLTNAKPWIKVATQIRTNYNVLDESTYVETTPYECIGHSIVLYHFEAPPQNQHLILKNGDRLLVVDLSLWKGKIPVKGDKIYLGRTDNDYVFFQAIKNGDTFLLELSVAKELAIMEKERQDYETKQTKK